MSKIIIFMILFLLSISLYSQRDSSLLYFGPSFDNVLNPGLNRISIEHNGINRTFWVETPDSYSSNHNYPVLMYFHYYGGSGGTTSMSSMVNNENFIGVYPDGVNGTWNTGILSDSQFRSVANDYDFVLEIIDWLEIHTRINKNKLYAFGISAGAFFLYEQVASQPNDFSAFALLMASHYDCELSNIPIKRCLENRPLITHDRPVSILHMHGIMDNSVPLEGGPMGQYSSRNTSAVYIKSVYDTINIWIDHNQCNSEPDKIDYFEFILLNYQNCKNSREIVVYLFHYAGHGQFNDYLPSGFYGDGIITAVWDFFEDNGQSNLSWLFML